MNKKILTIPKLCNKSEIFKKKNKKIIHCHGTFDLLHAGHIKYLQAAKNKGDLLFVTVTGDSFVNKGPGRPVFNERIRAENIAALECVDYVSINYDISAVELLKKLKPDLYVKGSDYLKNEDDITGNIQREINAVREHGGDIFYTNEITYSSTNLINDYFDVFSFEAKEFLKKFKKKYSVEEIFNSIDDLQNLNVLVIGDVIIDQYHYVSTLGQTGKGNVFAVKHESDEQFLGGSLAVANHVAQYTSNITLLGALGDSDIYKDFILEKLDKNINPIFTYFKNSPTLTKRRFVDKDLAKLFEIYFFNETSTFVDNGDFIYKWLNKNLAKYDLVIAADFGNGFINNDMRKIICKKSKFLAVNTQINSGNRGYHVITKYNNADYVSLNEPEIRLATHNKTDSLEKLCSLILKKTNSKLISVTRGTQGAMMFDSNKSFYSDIPALSSRVIDRIGAGDAYLSLCSLCLGSKLDSELSNFIGSVAAALDVQIVCNREPIKVINLKKYMNTLLK